tara:strand:+ start:3305 stop:3793 length:489 start_codon:yes stop_codon:yes gene_type:complete
MQPCTPTSTNLANESSASPSGSGFGKMYGFQPSTFDDYDYTKSFEGFLHNPYGYLYLTDVQRSAVDASKNPEKLYNLLMKHFGNRNYNQMKGLVYLYKGLYKVVLNDKLVGMILNGADNNSLDLEISEYTTFSGEQITLTVQSLCYCLIKEYILDENLDKLC